MKVQGKQVAESTITQNNIGVTTASVQNDTDVTTKEWVDNYVVGQITGLTYSTSNLNMAALDTTQGSGSQLACNTGITTLPNSVVRVMINGVEINVGGTTSTYGGFFSPDGTVVRLPNDEQVGDKLYWNTDTVEYQLDTTDEIDFIYLIRQ